MRDKVYLIFDKTKASLKIKSILIKKIKTTSLIKSNIIIVLGGDGFMLQTLKKLYKYKKPFYGINSGNYGFLMNKFSKENIIKNLNISNSIKIYPNLDKTKKIFKWSPKTSIDNGLLKTVKFYKKSI